MKYLVQFSRFLVGTLFIFSGAIKANDTVGFSIKLSEYFGVFDLTFLDPLALQLAVLICVVEIALGVALIIAWQIKPVSWLLLGMIVFFTWLTGYSAFTGKVTDCGCFGDAIPFTPIESFQKDLVLVVLIGLIFWKQKLIKPLISFKPATVVIGAASLVSLIFCIYCIRHLPVKDFRAYKVGNNITELMTMPEDAPLDEYKTVFVLKNKKTGSNEKFENTLPPDYGENWEYVDRKDELVKKGYEPPIHDFRISDDAGDEYTEDILTNPGYSLWVIVQDFDKANKQSFEKFNSLTKEAEQNGVSIIGLTSSLPETAELARHNYELAYPFYFMDGTTIKTIVRSNPALLLIKNGVIKGKWHHNDLPTFSELPLKD
jgi:uncharacterized membrane protein YphA (DoxX/SURF4 family)